MCERARIARAFVEARWGSRHADRDALLRAQSAALSRFLHERASTVDFYRAFRGAPLSAWPVVDKQTMLANFAALNTRRITLDRAMSVAVAAERSRDFAPTIDGLTVGLSSGTSGRRGVFLVSADERRRWAGLILARLLTPASLQQLVSPWRPPLAIAFFLRANSNLYETVASRRLRFAFHDLAEPMAAHIEQLNATPPDVVIAPPTVLHELAQAQLRGDLRIRPRQVVSVAEVLEPDDRLVIDRAFGVPLQEVYQATEGFLAVSCAAGRLHLNEDVLHIEPEWLDTEQRRFRPIVTDFTRSTQLIVRYRLDDVLRASADPCPCGRVTMSLDAVEGRADDVLWWPGVSDGAPQAVFPDTIRRSMALAGEAIRDYRIEQRGDTLHARLHVSADEASEAQSAVSRELAELFRRASVRPPALQFDAWVADDPLVKRRRIRRVPVSATVEARA